MEKELKQVLKNQEIIMQTLLFFLEKDLGIALGSCANPDGKITQEVIKKYSDLLVNLNHQMDITQKMNKKDLI